MIRSFFKIAWRQLLSNKIYSAINITGLAIGLTCFVLLTLYVRDELSYDRHHTKGDRIYRLDRTFLSADKTPSLRLGHTAPPFGPLIRTDFPEVEETVRLFGTNAVVSYNESHYKEENIFAAEETLFRVFNFHLLAGNPETALKAPFSILLSKPMAQKYFGTSDPIGKVLRLDNQLDYAVTGVFEPLPAQSTFHPEFLISFSTLNDNRVYGADALKTAWGNNSFSTFLLLSPDASPEKLVKAFPAFQDKHIGPNTSSYSVLGLTPLMDIHLHSQLDSEIEANSDIRYVYYFSTIALFILLIACINYMNLTTARAGKRSKEIGMRGLAGAGRKQLIGQFLCESLLLTLFAFVLAAVLTLLCLPVLNDFTSKTLTITQLLTPVNLGILLAAVLGTALLSGSYPALYLTSVPPLEVLKGLAGFGLKSGRLRKILVVLQFALATLLICCTLIVYRQLQFMRQYDLGYNKEQVVVLRAPDQPHSFESFRDDLLRDADIRVVGRSSRLPSGRLLDYWDSKVIRGDSLKPADVVIKSLTVDENFIPAYNIRMVAGRNFAREFPTDSTSAFIINQTAAQMLGWQDASKAVGNTFMYGDIRGKIIGIMHDFHFESLHQRIVPMVLFMKQSNKNWWSVRINPQHIPATLAFLESTWKAHFPQEPFNAQFLDDRFAKLYAREQQQQQLTGIFAGIAIFISCMGLLGLSIYMTEIRTKEIGVRKTLGASVGNIVQLLTLDYLKPVLIAIAFAAPLAWVLMSRWLQDFAYRIEIQGWMPLCAGILAVLIALFTISFQAIKAATDSPVKSLRTE